MKSKLFVLALLFGFTFSISAQKMTIENVQKVSARNASAIKEGSEVKGYYIFYISDKIDKKTNEYTLRITDNNLKMLKDVKFQDSKHVYILESSFNGTDLIFLLYNDDERTFDYQVYGADGKKKFNYTRQLTKKEERFLESTYLNFDDDEEQFKGLYPIEGNGFISVMPSREDKDYTFQVDYFATGNRKTWSYTPTDGKRLAGDYLGCYKGIIYIEVLKYDRIMDQKPDSYILGLNLMTGKKVFETPTDGKFRFYPASLSLVNEGKAYIYGEYFDVDGNIMKDKSKGYAFWEIDETGKITSEKYLSWDIDMAKYLDVTSKGKIADFGFMYLHQIVQMSDGKIYAIGEGFKKQASALGIATTVLGGGRGRASVTKIQVTDMMILTFDQNFNIKGAKVYEKRNNNVELPGGTDFVSTPLLGKMLKYSYGGFDYEYTQVNKDLTSFSVCYSDFVKEKGTYKGGTFNSITVTDGKVSTDRINTKSDAKLSAVYPNSQGKVMILDFFKKEKKMELHIEKLN